MLTQEQVKQYLQRIDYHCSVMQEVRILSALQWAHLTHIPYENLDILAGIPLSLEPQDLFRKIVADHRGGYCFELQGLFKELLQALGFSVVQYAARFLDEGPAIQMRRHRVLVVTIDGQRYLVDVGVRNESPRKALHLICGEVQSDGVCQYRFEKDSFFGWVLLQKEQGKDWKPMYDFTEEIQVDNDFVMPSFYCEKHPDSGFNKYMKISIFQDASNFTIVNGVFKEYRSGRVQLRKHLAGPEELRSVLAQYFGLKKPPYLPPR
jgi:arylamine N-acetyltransferase